MSNARTVHEEWLEKRPRPHEPLARVAWRAQLCQFLAEELVRRRHNEEEAVYLRLQIHGELFMALSDIAAVHDSAHAHAGELIKYVEAETQLASNLANRLPPGDEQAELLETLRAINEGAKRHAVLLPPWPIQPVKLTR